MEAEEVIKIMGGSVFCSRRPCKLCGVQIEIHNRLVLDVAPRRAWVEVDGVLKQVRNAKWEHIETCSKYKKPPVETSE